MTQIIRDRRRDALKAQARDWIKSLALSYPIGLAWRSYYVRPDAPDGFAAAYGEDQHRIRTRACDYVHGTFEIENG